MKNIDDEENVTVVRNDVKSFMSKFSLYPELH